MRKNKTNFFLLAFLLIGFIAGCATYYPYGEDSSSCYSKYNREEHEYMKSIYSEKLQDFNCAHWLKLKRNFDPFGELGCIEKDVIEENLKSCSLL